MHRHQDYETHRDHRRRARHPRQLCRRIHPRGLCGAHLRQPRAGHGPPARARLPDLAVIDISLEDEPEGGFELCRALRAMSAELPIIFLTARDSEIDAVSGLRLGADDFLTKDLSIPHLIARVNALFRRIEALRKPHATSQSCGAAPLTLDGERMQVQWDGQVVLLSLTEFWIVHALARHPGHVRNRQQLMDAANVVLDDNTITSHVKRIRRKFQAARSEIRCHPDRVWHGLSLGGVSAGAQHVAAPEAAAARARHAGAAVGGLSNTRARWKAALREGEQQSLQAMAQTIAASLQGRTDLLYRIPGGRAAGGLPGPTICGRAAAAAPFSRRLRR